MGTHDGSPERDVDAGAGAGAGAGVDKPSRAEATDGRTGTARDSEVVDAEPEKRAPADEGQPSLDL